MPIRTVKKFSVDANVIDVGIGFGTEFSDNLAIYGDKSGRDDLLGLAAGGNSGGGDDFLQTFSRHGWMGLRETRLIRLDSIA
jgi:hypothetical protein